MKVVRLFKLFIREASSMKLIRMLILFFTDVMLSITLLYAKTVHKERGEAL